MKADSTNTNSVETGENHDFNVHPYLLLTKNFKNLQTQQVLLGVCFCELPTFIE